MKSISRVHVYLFILLQVCHQQAHGGLSEMFMDFADIHTPTGTSTGAQAADAFPSDSPVDKTPESVNINSGNEPQNKQTNEISLASKQTNTQKTARDMPSNSFPSEFPADERVLIQPGDTAFPSDPPVQPADTHVFIPPQDTSVQPDHSVQPDDKVATPNVNIPSDNTGNIPLETITNLNLETDPNSQTSSIDPNINYFFQPNFPIGKPYMNLETGKVDIFDPFKNWVADQVDASHQVDILAPSQDKPATNTGGASAAMETHHSDSMSNVPWEHVGSSTDFSPAVHSHHVDVLPDFTATDNVNQGGSIDTQPIEHAVKGRVGPAAEKSADFIPDGHSHHIDVLPDFTGTDNVNQGGSSDTQRIEHAVERGVETAAEKSVGFTPEVSPHGVGVAADSTFFPAPIEHVPDFVFNPSAIERAVEKDLESTFDTHKHTDIKPIVNGQDVKPHVEIREQTTVKPKPSGTKRLKWYERIRNRRRKVRKTTTTENPLVVSKALQDLYNKSLNSFGKNRGLERILRNNRRRERERRKKEREQKKAEARAKSRKKNQKKKGTQVRRWRNRSRFSMPRSQGLSKRFF